MPDYIFINATGHELAAEAFETPAQARAHAEHLAITERTAVTFAEVIAYRVQPTCMLCSPLTPGPSPRGRGEGVRAATLLAGDWQLCEDCYNAIAAPDGEEEAEAEAKAEEIAAALLDLLPRDLRPCDPATLRPAYTVSARLVFSLARPKAAVE